VLKHRNAFALAQSPLGKAGEQVGIRMDPGLGGCLEALAHEFG
jgi:hypothetical protein